MKQREGNAAYCVYICLLWCSVSGEDVTTERLEDRSSLAAEASPAINVTNGLEGILNTEDLGICKSNSGMYEG